MSRPARLLLLAAPSLIAYGLVQLAVWPGQMTADSLSQWLYLSGIRPTTDLHSAFHVAMLWVLTRLWHSPAAVILVQIAALSLVTALILDELRLWSVPTRAIVIAAVGFPLFPANLFVSTVLWIDVPHAIATLLSLYCVLIVVRERGESIHRWRFIVAFTLTLLLLAFLRHNGVIAAALTAGVVALVYRSRRTAIVFLIVLVVPYAVREFAYPRIGIVPLPNSFKGIPPLHVLGAYAAEGKLLAETIPTVTAIASIEFLASSYTCEAESIFYTDGTNRTFITDHLGAVYGAALANIRADPAVYLRHLACVTELLWKPITFTPKVIGYPPLRIDDLTPDGSEARRWGLQFSPMLPALREKLTGFFDWTADAGRVWLFWRPAIPLYFTIAVGAVLAVRRRRAELLLVALPAIAATVSIAPLIVAPVYRYQYALTGMALLTWPLLVRHPHRRLATRSLTGVQVSAAIACGLVIATYAPGYMATDSLIQLDEARAGEFWNWSPPLMAFVWRLLDGMIPGPLPMLVLQNAMFWSGVALLLEKARGWRALAPLGLLAVPPIAATLGVVWKDVQMLGALTLAAGLIARANAGARIGRLAGAVACLQYAMGCRFNAMMAVAPLAVWWASVAVAGRNGRRWAIATALVGLLTCTDLLVSHALRAGRTIFPSQLAFIQDLAGMSVRRHKNAFPRSVPSFSSPTAYPVIRRVFDPRSVNPILVQGRYRASTREDYAAIRAAWVRVISRHPRDWLAVRWGLFGNLIGMPGQEPFYPVQVNTTENGIGYRFERSWWNRLVTQSTLWGVDHGLMRPWLYLVANGLAAAILLVRSRRHRGLVAVLLTSALLYTAALFVVCPSSEYRYLLWPVAATALAWLVPATAPASHPVRKVSPARGSAATSAPEDAVQARA